mgnify:CR=1 FL=1
MKTKATKKILKSVYLFSVVSLLITGGLVAFFSLSPFYDQLIQNQKEKFQNRTDIIAQSINFELKKMTALTEYLAVQEEGRKLLSIYSKRNVLPEGFKSLSKSILEKTIKANNNIIGISRVSYNSDLLVSVGQPFSYINILNSQEDFNIVQNGKDLNIITVSRIFDDSGNILGYDLVNFDANKLFLSMENKFQSELGMVNYIVDAENNVIFSWNNNLSNLENKDNLILKSKLANSDLNVLSLVSNKAILAPVYERVKFLSILVMFLVGIGIVINKILLNPLTDKILLNNDQLEAEIREKTFDLEDELNIRKLAEKELKASYEAMEISTKVINNLTSILNNELKDAISKFKDSLNLFNTNGLTVENSEYLMKVTEEINLLEEYLSQINLICNSEFDLYEFKPARFSLDLVMQSWMRLLSVRAAQEDRFLEYSIDEDVPNDLVGDPLRVGQVLSYLIEHIISLSLPDTDIEVNIVKAESKVDEVGLQFRLNASGLELLDEEIDKINEYFKTNISNQNKIPIAFTMANKLAKSHSGNIWIEKLEAEGIQINIIFSFAIANKNLEIREETRLATGAWMISSVKPTKSTAITRTSNVPINVLVAENSLINSKVLKSLLEARNCKVELANNASDAIDNLHNKSFDLVFIDEDLTNIAENQLYNVLKKSNFNKEVPIVAIKSENSLGNLNEVFCDLIEKPLNPQSIYKTLAKWV